MTRKINLINKNIYGRMYVMFYSLSQRWLHSLAGLWSRSAKTNKLHSPAAAGTMEPSFQDLSGLKNII